MAKAAKIQETVTKREKVNRIQLTLTEGEADFLQAILAHIGGDPTTSPRKYQERIARVLRNATGQSYSATDAYQLTNGGIMCADYPQPAPKPEDIFAPPMPDRFARSLF